MPGDKLLDIAQERVRIACPKGVISVRIFDEPGGGNLCCQLAAGLDRNARVRPTVQNQRRDLHGRKYWPDVDLRIQQRERPDSTGTRREPLEFCKLVDGLLAYRLAG